MNRNFLAAVAAGALLLGANAANAAVQVYDFSVYNTGFVGNLGTVTVTDNGTNTLDFDVVLAANTFFQLQGNGNLKNALWFDLPGLAGNTSVTYNISAPNGPAAGTGDYPTGGLFTGANYSSNAFGQGWSSGYDYAVMVEDASTGGGDTNYYTGHLTFSVIGNAPLSIASLGTGQPETVGGKAYNVVFGADLRQCLGQGCVTGPVGAIAVPPGGVPEPATWAMMLFGFGGIGALLRRRREVLAYA